MKKLTAGIFATILGLTTVDAFAASVASTNYVKGAITETLNDAKAYTDEKVAGIEIPTIDHLATKTELQAVDTAYRLADTTLQANIDKKLDSTTAAATYETIENAKAYAKKAELAAVATSGSYTDLQNKPIIPSIEGLAQSSEVTALAGRVTTAEGDIDALETSVATKAAASDVTALAGRVTTAEGDIDALETSVATKAAASDVTALAGRVTTAEGDIDALETSVATKAAASDVTALAGRVSTNETAISDLQSADTALGQRIDEVVANAYDDTELAGRVSANETAISSLQSADTALGTRVTAAEGKIETLTTGHEYQANQIATNETAIADIKTEQTTQNADIAALKSGKADASDLSKYVLLTDVVDTYTK